MSNIWQKGSILTNPYYETAFQALGIPPELLSRAAIDQKVGERRQAIQHVPDCYELGKRPLTETDIINARQILLDPNRRILEELLEHHPEQLPLDEVERIQARLPQPTDWPDVLPQPHQLRFLLYVVQELAIAYLQALPPATAPPAHLDLTLTPPCHLPP